MLKFVVAFLTLVGAFVLAFAYLPKFALLGISGPFLVAGVAAGGVLYFWGK